MQNTFKNLILALFSLMGARLIVMYYFPLTDSTEARYANTALMMAKLNDWISPYYDYGVPFWGKPPLSFWAEALSYKLLGISDFAPRLPSLLISLATAWLMYHLVKTLTNAKSALWSVVIYFGMLLSFQLSGAVLTDPFLSFSTTLSLVAFMMFTLTGKRSWGYLFFIGLGLGLLAKGPLAVVIVGGILFLWMLPSVKTRFRLLKPLPWMKGTLLMLIISVPWYIIAEMKTPGFLNYFIIGEHFGRFLDSGWHGDKYGYVHKNPHGAIWLMWLAASLPWGISAFFFGYQSLYQHTKREMFLKLFKDPIMCLLLIWALFLILFFTLASNVIWTYVLPSLPAFAILLALLLNQNEGSLIQNYPKMIALNIWFVPVVSLIGLGIVLWFPNLVMSEKYLIDFYRHHASSQEPIYFLEKKSFSSMYYMNEPIQTTSLEAFNDLNISNESHYFVVVNKGDEKHITHQSDLHKLYSSKSYVLYEGKSASSNIEK